MKVNMRLLLERCIEEGLDRGYLRAHKHTDEPTKQHILSQIHDAIWLEIDEYFDFEDQE